MIDEGGDCVEPALESAAGLRSLLKRAKVPLEPFANGPGHPPPTLELLGDRLSVSHEMDSPEPVAERRAELLEGGSHRRIKRMPTSLANTGSALRNR